jgi:bacterioferritin-associated ferredoxin
MKDNIIQISCIRNTGSAIKSDAAHILCPKCKHPGDAVENITVRHIVKMEFIKKLELSDYYLCTDEKCEVAYYTKNHEYFKQTEIKVPLWYKKNAEPKYACYCSKITENDVEKAITEHYIKTIMDIRQLYDPDAKCQCKIKNPSGKCCHAVFQKIINKYKK